MPFFYLPDRYYILLVIPAMLIALWAQMRVKSTFAKYSREGTYGGLTGAQAARRILDANGLTDVRIEPVRGSLTDHYDPRDKVVRLSMDVYGCDTVAAVGVAAHETGHAIQHAVGYFPLQLRNAIIPITNIGSQLSIPLVFIGYFLGMQPLVSLGILLFSLVTVFQLITLPVEFNASRRALATLDEYGMVNDYEHEGVRKVLSAAALTYVAALIVSLANLLRLILPFGGRRDD
mgnify:FL=1